MSFSLTTILEYLDSQPEMKVMSTVSAKYEDNDRGIFSPKLVPYDQLFLLGYAGLRQMLLSLYEIDPDFVASRKHELHSLVKDLKGENHG